MITWEYALGALLIVAVGLLAYRLGVASRFYLKYRGERMVECPENRQPAVVAVAAARGAAGAVAGIPPLRLEECSRWPERAGCGQECLRQIEADPQSCLVWNVVNTWYQGKSCAVCDKPFGLINWHDHRPALLDANRQTVMWTDVSPERLPEVFASHWPVCWDCHVAEAFRRQHPELVTDRPKH